MQRSCVTPFRERGRSTHMEYRQLPNSLIRCTTGWPHQEDQKKVIPHLKACPETLSCCSTGELSLEQRWKKESFDGVQLQTPRKRWGLILRHVVQHFDRRCETWNKADCFTLLRRIIKLKTVNSEVRSVNSLPKRGSLKWVHGTMLESPWKSH